MKRLGGSWLLATDLGLGAAVDSAQAIDKTDAGPRGRLRTEHRASFRFDFSNKAGLQSSEIALPRIFSTAPPRYRPETPLCWRCTWLCLVVKGALSSIIPKHYGSRGGVRVRPLASHLVRFAAGSLPGFSQVGIVQEDAVGRRVFSGISLFPSPLRSCAALCSPRFTLIGSMLRVAHISSLCGNSLDSHPGGPGCPVTRLRNKTEHVFSGLRVSLPEDGTRWQFPKRHILSVLEKTNVFVPGEVLKAFAIGNRAGRCRWSAGFLGDLPFPPPLHSGTAPYSLQSPSSALKTALLRAAQVFSLTHSTAMNFAGEPGSITGRVTPKLSHMGMVSDDAAGLRDFSGVSRFPRHFIPALLHTHLKDSLLRAVQISSLFNHSL
ncbi:hypothetical protein PR048_024523 [Dryococelus australis]|uniref:Uncharacterized protein n=1 Tax=Dryococelus australis TaxID=614101 RepID=A0ABQ9GNV4_9NEOP|nr:hypothetical protein PR048_024523 [Dryococelus australis]